jgi:Fe-S cluster biosynthesis and repair protein YggX
MSFNGDDPGTPAAGGNTGRTVFCVKLRRQAPGLERAPWPGELGQRIYENISIEAWNMWEDRMRMILNEYRLLPFQKEAQDLIARHMEEFLFGGSSALPPGYSPEDPRNG